jgi:hypothetical protein
MANHKIIDLACDVAPPFPQAGLQSAPSTATTYGVFYIATTNGNQRFNVPLKWRNRWWNVEAFTLDIYFGLGASTLSLTAADVSTVASENITLLATTGLRIAAGTSKPFFVPGDSAITDFCVASTGTTGFVQIYPASNPIPANKKA